MCTLWENATPSNTARSIWAAELYAIPGYYLLEECSPTSAGNLDWVLEQLAGGLKLPQDKPLYGASRSAGSICPRLTSIRPEPDRSVRSLCAIPVRRKRM